MRLHVIARTCSNSLLTPTDLKRVCGDNRKLMMKKCFTSLVNSIKASQHEVTLTVVDDHSDAEFLEFVRNTTEGLAFDLVSVETRGFNSSALEQFTRARDSDSLVYVVEDDYLHEPMAIDYMVGAYLYFLKRYNQSTLIYPYDCSLRYQEGAEEPTLLYHDGVRYWRSVGKTAGTFLTHYSTLQQHWDPFLRLATEYPSAMEDDTINTLYWSSTQPNAPIRVFSPIPSVAYHLGYSTPTGISTNHSRWEHLWETIPNWSLIQGWFYWPEFYQQVVRELPSPAKIVEVGTWRGRSTCFLAECVKRSGKHIEFWAVDTFLGSNESIHQTLVANMTTDLYTDFLNNLEMCEVSEIVTPLKSSSVTASRQFSNSSLDFVMIDGAHDRESVLQDINAWLPKIKPGGLIAGDDYGGEWTGVKQSVDEVFGDQVKTSGSVWYATV